MVWELFSLNWRRAKRYFAIKRAAKIITALLFAAVFLGVAFGIYKFFFYSLTYISYYVFLKTAISLYSYELYFLLVGFLVWVSSIIVIIFSVFSGKTYNVVIASPEFKAAPKYGAANALLSSIWIFMFVLLPAVLAMSKVSGAGFGGIFAVLLAGVLFLAFTIYATFAEIMLVSMLISRVRKTWLTLGNLVLSQIVLVIGAFVFIGSKISRLDLVQILNVLDLRVQQAAFAQLLANFKIFPTNLVAESMLNAQAGQTAAAFGRVGLLFILASVAYGIFLLSLRGFLPVWQALAEGSQAKIADNAASKQRNMIFRRILKGPSGAIFYKELVSTFRNMRSAFWMLFLLLLWFSHIGVNILFQRNLHRYNFDNPNLTAVMIALQLTIICYFLAAMILRFAFPSFSAEKNTAWIIASSPLSYSRLLWVKFGFFAAVFSIFALVIEAVNLLVLHLPAPHALMFLILAVVCCLFLTALGLALGAIFPNFESDDPQILSTSIPGLAMVFGAVIYGALASLAFYDFTNAGNYLRLLSFMAGSVLLSFAIISLAAALSARVEFVKGE